MNIRAWSARKSLSATVIFGILLTAIVAGGVQMLQAHGDNTSQLCNNLSGVSTAYTDEGATVTWDTTTTPNIDPTVAGVCVNVELVDTAQMLFGVTVPFTAGALMVDASLFPVTAGVRPLSSASLVTGYETFQLNELDWIKGIVLRTAAHYDDTVLAGRVTALEATGGEHEHVYAHSLAHLANVTLPATFTYHGARHHSVLIHGVYIPPGRYSLVMTGNSRQHVTVTPSTHEHGQRFKRQMTLFNSVTQYFQVKPRGTAGGHLPEGEFRLTAQGIVGETYTITIAEAPFPAP